MRVRVLLVIPIIASAFAIAPVITTVTIAQSDSSVTTYEAGRYKVGVAGKRR